MASLPLFSPSFMPNGGASFASSRPETARTVAQRADPGSPLSSLPKSRAKRESRFGPPSPSASGSKGRSEPHGVARTSSSRSLFDPPPSHEASSQSSVDRFDAAPEPSVDRFEAMPTSAADPSGAIPSTVERTEAALREAGLAGRFWRGDALSASPLPSIPSGFRALDEQLPDGGWPSRCLTELLLSHVGAGEIRFLAATLASLTQASREIVLLGPPHIPDPTGWEQLGIDMRRVLIVRAERPADRLWALEQSLKSSAFGALVAWLPEERTLARHDALRRLQLAAASANGLTFLLRPAAAQYQASPAPLRLTLAVGQPAGHRRTLSVRLLKRRGPVLAAPLTLALPEIHRGMKAFGRASREDSMPATSLPLPSLAASSQRSASPSSSTTTSPPTSASMMTTTTRSTPSSATASMSRVVCSVFDDPSRAPSSPTAPTDPIPRIPDALAGALLSDAGG